MALLNSETEDRLQSDEIVKTKLHFPADWGISTKEKYIYQYHHTKLPAIKAGQLSIQGVRFLEVDGEIVVGALLQSAVPNPIQIEAVNLVLTDEENQIAAQKQFDLGHVGEIAPCTAIPLRFLFLAEDRLSDKRVTDRWKIQFQITSKQETLDLDPSWEERLSLEQKQNLQDILKGLPALGDKEVNMHGIEIRLLDNGSLAVTILIRNGTARGLNLEQLPLSVADAAGDLVCQGQFQLPPLQIKPRGAKPWTFIFPAELVLKQNPDLSKWQAFIQK